MDTEKETIKDKNRCHICETYLSLPPNGCSNYANHYRYFPYPTHLNIGTGCSWGMVRVPWTGYMRSYYEAPHQTTADIQTKGEAEALQTKEFTNAYVKALYARVNNLPPSPMYADLD